MGQGEQYVRRHAKAPSTGSALRAGSRLGRIVRGAFATCAAFSRADGSGTPSRGQSGAARPRLLAALAAALALTLLLGVTLASATAPAAAQPECPTQPEFGPSANLPNCRVYEQVTPADKNGADVNPNATRTHASSDGNRVVFPTIVAFGDAQGTGSTSDYMAVRDADGHWGTHGITPLMEPSDYQTTIGASEPTYLWLSPDLANGIYRSTSPLAGATNTEGVQNLYLRDDLFAAGPGTYTILTDAPASEPPPSDPYSNALVAPLFAGASADFSHVVFQSRRALTADAPVCAADPCPTLLYEWVQGDTRLVGILPASEGGGAAPTSQAGTGASHVGQPARAVSEDGSRIVFTVPAESSSREGELYLRDDHGTLATADDTTVHLNASESDTPLFGPASFWVASRDLSKIFFTSGGELYRYDLDAPADGHLTLVSVDSEPFDASGGGVQGVIGASSDASIVYFITRSNQLVAGGPTGNDGGGYYRIFIWQGGLIHEVGAVSSGDSEAGLGLAGNVPQTARVTPDGHLAFLATGTSELLSLYGQPEYDHGTCSSYGAFGGCREAYVYDAAANDGAGDLRCASCIPNGAEATTSASFIQIGQLGLGLSTDTRILNHVLSDDGRYVFFNTEEKLVEEDTNGVADAYEYDTETHEVHLISTGTDSDRSFFLDASPDGHDAFFITRAQLRSSDLDQSFDLYDARIDGAPDPGPPNIAECLGDACPGLASEPVPGASPQTDRASGAGNLIRRRCPKGKRRVRVRGKSHCLKPRKHPGRAKHNRRTHR
jgi:hypothetical protein